MLLLIDVSRMLFLFAIDSTYFIGELAFFYLHLQVVIPLSLQRRVEGLLQEHLDRLQLSSTASTDISGDKKTTDQVQDDNNDENPDSFLDGSVMEKVLQRQSLRMRNMQRAWQVYYAT